MTTQAIPIGIDNFSELLDSENHYLFTDKTLMIADIIDNKQKIELILRPRRWGKTLNMSMLQYFFSPTVYGKSTRGMFDRLKIATEAGQAYMQHQGKHPVISISFKDIKEANFKYASAKLVLLVQEVFRAHRTLLTTPDISAEDKALFTRLLRGEGSKAELENSLKFLSQLLYEQAGTQVYILVDEYDTPLTHAYLTGYFDEMAGLMRNLFGAALKGNIALKKGVITGILRLAKENLLSGLNNLKTHSLLDKPYSAHYGFTKAETLTLLKTCHLQDKADAVQAWYNGYRFGEYTMYNPWSIMNCLDDEGSMKPYWVNTAGHDLIRKALEKPDEGIRDAFLQLLQGKSITAFIYDRITYIDLSDSHKLWSLLLFAGYLNALSIKPVRAHHTAELAIPNYEIQALYEDMFIHWLRKGWGDTTYQDFIAHLTQGKVTEFIEQLNEFLLQSSSYHDTAHSGEAFYHGFVLGLVSCIRDTHWVRSNRESGLGRYDLMIIPKTDTSSELGILLEFKFVDKSSSETKLTELAQKALTQMTQQQYITELQSQPQVKQILSLGLAFSAKQVIAQHQYLAG